MAFLPVRTPASKLMSTFPERQKYIERCIRLDFREGFMCAKIIRLKDIANKNAATIELNFKTLQMRDSFLFRTMFDKYSEAPKLREKGMVVRDAGNKATVILSQRGEECYPSEADIVMPDFKEQEEGNELQKVCKLLMQIFQIQSFCKN